MSRVGGGRPYECVRRAWHSDRHQPIRGSLIQDIFRIANEIHSPATKKKKEWQEKLPIVVLKAEEIMYSKANSEVEYMDIKTLWERANDAINTIIRRDEANEVTGEFLQPCIEAALHLGCIPRRASRSQRNNQPRGYLSGKMDMMPPAKDCPNHITPWNSCIISEMPFLSRREHPPFNGVFPSESSSCPLYYPSCSQPKHTPQLSLSIKDLDGVGDGGPDDGCDLSLRLGFGRMEDDGIDVNSSNSGGKNAASGGKLDLFRGKNGGGGSDALDVGPAARKRKAGELTDQRRHWSPTLMLVYPHEGTRTAWL